MMSRTMDRKKLINLILTGIFAALTVVLTMVSVPMLTGVPISLQPLGIALCGFVLGAKFGTLSVLVYCALGAIGLPVFSGFASGFGVMLGVTGGFIWGFIVMALICGLGVKLKNKILSISMGVGGLLVCHIFGVVQFSLLMGRDLFSSALLVSVPYIIKDIVLVIGAYFMSMAIKKAIERI